MRNCKQCDKELRNKREDTKYCSHNCKQKQFKRREQIKLRIRKLEKEQLFNIEFLLELDSKLNNGRLIIEEEIRYLNGKLREPNAKFRECKRVIELNRAEFRNELFNELMADPKYSHYRNIIQYGAYFEKESLINQFREDFRIELEDVRKECIGIVRKRKSVRKRLDAFDETEIEKRINKITIENEQFEKELVELKNVDLDRLPPVIRLKTNASRKNVKTSPKIARSGYDVIKMEFQGLTLNGEFGKFFGKIQREKCAIALTGNSGAGKSTFSYQIARAFLERDQSVAYFSLEEGITESTKALIEKFKLDKYQFKIFAEGDLEDVRTEADNFDCVIIDSYSKLSSKADDFENLRQDFPNTFFVIIFQKTTDGKIRGGSSITYNSTAVIDIQVKGKGHRIALMQKSRYGTENFIFSISENRILKGDKLPVDWKEIEF